ncbi:hypothetical protein E4U44_008188 [Claviceps purpurea]|nr:hypothetical protein E4U44_008188 [Claviceps purpurea]
MAADDSRGNGGGKKNQTHNFHDPQETRQRLYVRIRLTPPSAASAAKEILGFGGGEDVDGYDEDEENFLGDEANDDVQEHFNHVENANLDDKRRRAEVLCMSSNAGDVAVKTKRVRFDVSGAV